MNVNSVPSPDAAIAAVVSGEDKRLALQTALLRKSLESQRQQSAEIQRLVEGKGRLLDIRV
jgi:hypothetical protein